MIDPLTEELIRPIAAAKLYPRGPDGKPPHVSRVYRDLKRGCRGVQLESIRTPKLTTSRQAVAPILSPTDRNSRRERPPTRSRQGPRPRRRTSWEGARSTRLLSLGPSPEGLRLIRRSLNQPDRVCDQRRRPVGVERFGLHGPTEYDRNRPARAKLVQCEPPLS